MKGNLISWEVNDPLKVLVAVITVPVLSYLLAAGYLHSMAGLANIHGSEPPIFSPSTATSSMSAHWLFVYPTLVPGFWILLSLFTSVVSVLTFRYDRDRGYALSIYSLPHSKLGIYISKVASTIIFAVLASIFPLLAVAVFLNADLFPVLWSILGSTTLLYELVLTFYFVFFVLSVSVLFSVLFRNMFLSFLAAFFVTVVPYFSSLIMPPFSFVEGFTDVVNGGTPFSPANALTGLALPIILLLFSLLLFLRGDVV